MKSKNTNLLEEHTTLHRQVGYAIFDQKRKCRYANSVLLEIMGFASDEVVGETLDELFGSDQLNSLLNGELTDSAHSIEIVKNNLQLSLVLLPLEKGEVFLLVEDITAQKTNRDTFVSYVSHELKNPLTVITGFTQLLKRRVSESSDQKSGEYVDRIGQKAMHLEMLINQTADELRSLNSSYRIKPELVDIVELIQNVTTLFSALNQDFTIEIDNQLKGQKVLADPKKLFQVFASVLNTVSTVSTDQKLSIRLTAQTKKVSLSIPFKTNWSGKQLSELSTPYFYIDEAVNFIPLGLNTGLYGTSQIIHSHKGELSLQRESNSIQKLVIELPTA